MKDMNYLLWAIIDFALFGLNLGIFLMNDSVLNVINLIVACICLCVGIFLLSKAIKEE